MPRSQPAALAGSQRQDRRTACRRTISWAAGIEARRTRPSRPATVQTLGLDQSSPGSELGSIPMDHATTAARAVSGGHRQSIDRASGSVRRARTWPTPSSAPSTAPAPSRSARTPTPVTSLVATTTPATAATANPALSPSVVQPTQRRKNRRVSTPAGPRCSPTSVTRLRTAIVTAARSSSQPCPGRVACPPKSCGLPRPPRAENASGS